MELKFNNKKKYLIIGGDSFLSKNICDLFDEKKISFFVTSRRKNRNKNFIYLNLGSKDNHNDIKMLKKVINKVDIIIFNVAFVGGVLFNLKSKITLDSHIRPLLDFINILIANKTSKKDLKFIFISSACVYPPYKKNIKYSEQMGDVLLPDRSNFTYAMSKRVMENICKSLSIYKNINYLILRPFNFYGPYDNFNEKTGHVISSLIKKFENFVYHNKPIKILGDLKSSRNFVFISDVVNVIILLSQNSKCSNTTINIGSEFNYRISDIKDVLNKIYSKKTSKKIKIINKKSIGVAQKYRSCDTKLLRKYIGKNFKFTNLDEGIAKTINYHNTLND